MEKKSKIIRHSFLFGPVPSRRLGMSLGVDLVPYKTCTMDCIYCESGPTTNLTLKREEFYDTADVIAELDAYLSTGPALDYVTFSGAGEPTLHSGIGEVIRFIKDKYPEYKICLLTNGMLLSDPDTFEDVKNIDMIVPSLDAPDPGTFNTINRPFEGFDYGNLIDSFCRFRRESKALFFLEIFIVPDINDSDDALKIFAEAIERIKPDKVQLNSLDRPGAEPWIPKMTKEGMERVKKMLSGSVEIEIIGKFISPDPEKSGNREEQYENLDQKVLDLISRRPCTAEDLQSSLGFSKNTIGKLLKRMVEKELITSETRERGEFYMPKQTD